MPLTHDPEGWQTRLAALPVTGYGPGETVFVEGTNTGRLLILKQGAVAIVKGGTEIARVARSGAVFGEISALLGQPHTADVRTLEASEFHIADASTLLAEDPAALLYVAISLAQRLDGANHLLRELKSEIQAGDAPGLIGKTIDRIEGLLGAIGTGYLRAGAAHSMYPFA